MASRSEQRTSIRLTTVQREMLDEFKGSMYGDRHVPPKYRRTADALVKAGLLRRAVRDWYEITEQGRSF